MKVEIVGALLHRPKVLFLDEPTFGLDVTMQRRIRSFIAEYNQRYGATVLLTSHYMADVEALCKRIIVIHNGKLLFDGDLSALMDRFSAYKTIGVTFSSNYSNWSQYGEVLSRDWSPRFPAGSQGGYPRADRPHPGRTTSGRPDGRRPAH